MDSIPFILLAVLMTALNLIDGYFSAVEHEKTRDLLRELLKGKDKDK